MEEVKTSPQYKAVSWLSGQDEFQLPVPTIDGKSVPHTRFTERYVLAVLYYSSGGEFWKHKMRFLEPIDHCMWYQDFVTTSGSYVRYGVTECKTLGSGADDELVHKIELRTLPDLSSCFVYRCMFSRFRPVKFSCFLRSLAFVISSQQRIDGKRSKGN